MRVFALIVGLVSWSFGIFGQSNFPLSIEIKDKITQRPLQAIVSVLEVGEEQELVGKMQGDAFVVQVKPITNYQVLVALQEYHTYRQVHQFEPNKTEHKLIIDLEPLRSREALTGIQQHTILIVDKDNKAPINRAKLILKTTTGQVVDVQKGSLLGSWTSSITAGETYQVEVSSPDYENYKATLVVKSSNPTQIGLIKIIRQPLRFQAVDALTNQPIAARFKLTDEISESYSGTTTTATLFEPTVVVQSQPYILYVSAPEYKDYQAKYNVVLTTEKNIEIIKLVKSSDIMVRVRVQDEKSRQPLNASIKVINKITQQPISTLKNASKAEIVVNSQQLHHIIVEAEGYDIFEQAINTTTASNGKMPELIITMVKPLAVVETKPAPAVATKPVAATTTPTTPTASTQVSTKTVATKEPKAETTIPTVTASAKTSPPSTTTEAPKVELAKIEPAPSRIFTFKISDAQTKKTVSTVKFQIINAADKKAVITKSFPTSVQANLQIDQNYIATIDAPNYERMTMRVDASAWAKRGEFLTNISLVSIPKKVAEKPLSATTSDKNFDDLKGGQSFQIEDNVYFDQSSYILRPEASVQLDKLVAALKKNPAVKIEITGHTDNVGDARLNLILSENRAKVIANYLAYRGIDEARIAHKGAGQTKPLASNDTEENKRKNRRVEFVIK